MYTVGITFISGFTGFFFFAPIFGYFGFIAACMSFVVLPLITMVILGSLVPLKVIDH